MKFPLNLILAMILITACESSSTKQWRGEIKTGLADTASAFPGTTIYIQLPKGFVWNETVRGFYKEEDGSVIKYDEYKTMRYAAKMPVEEPMASLVQEEPITISGCKGALLTHQDGQTFTRLLLTFGDGTFKKFIEATYFSTREQTGKEIQNALKTIVVK